MRAFALLLCLVVVACGKPEEETISTYECGDGDKAVRCVSGEEYCVEHHVDDVLTSAACSAFVTPCEESGCDCTTDTECADDEPGRSCFSFGSLTTVACSKQSP